MLCPPPDLMQNTAPYFFNFLFNTSSEIFQTPRFPLTSPYVFNFVHHTLMKKVSPQGKFSETLSITLTFALLLFIDLHFMEEQNLLVVQKQGVMTFCELSSTGSLLFAREKPQGHTFFQIKILINFVNYKGLSTTRSAISGTFYQFWTLCQPFLPLC